MHQVYILGGVLVVWAFLVGITCDTVVFLSSFAAAVSDPNVIVRASVPGQHPLPRQRVKRLPLEQAAMDWTDDKPLEGTSYSIIVMEFNHHQSNLFRDRERVKAFSPAGNHVVSVRFGNPYPNSHWNAASSEAPFFVGHPEGVDRRIRIVHAQDLIYRDSYLSQNQVRNLWLRARNVHLIDFTLLADSGPARGTSKTTPGRKTLT